MLKKGPALTVLAVLCVITAALIGTTLWRQFQFAEFLEADWMGLLALCAGQLGLYAFPAVWGYLNFYTGDALDVDAAMVALVSGGVVNILFAVITAWVEFGLLSFTTVTHTILPLLASLAVAGTVFLLACYRPAVGIKF